jgi:hypothetical protein
MQMGESGRDCAQIKRINVNAVYKLCLYVYPNCMLLYYLASSCLDRVDYVYLESTSLAFGSFSVVLIMNISERTLCISCVWAKVSWTAPHA